MTKGIGSKEHEAITAAIAGVMQKRRLNQEDVAEKMGWDAASMSRLMKHQRGLSAMEFAKLARVMGLRPSKLWQIVEIYL